LYPSGNTVAATGTAPFHSKAMTCGNLFSTGLRLELITATASRASFIGINMPRGCYLNSIAEAYYLNGCLA